MCDVCDTVNEEDELEFVFKDIWHYEKKSVIG